MHDVIGHFGDDGVGTVQSVSIRRSHTSEATVIYHVVSFSGSPTSFILPECDAGIRICVVVCAQCEGQGKPSSWCLLRELGLTPGASPLHISSYPPQVRSGRKHGILAPDSRHQA